MTTNKDFIVDGVAFGELEAEELANDFELNFADDDFDVENLEISDDGAAILALKRLHTPSKLINALSTYSSRNNIPLSFTIQSALKKELQNA